MRDVSSRKPYIYMTRLIALLAATALNCQAGLSHLEALSLIESGGNDRAIGGAGEVSRYQILPKVWRFYSQSSNYRSQWLSTEVARRHMETIHQAYVRLNGHPADDFDLYVMWNAGIDYYRRMGFDPQRVHRVIRERANRFVNLRRYESPPANTVTSTGPWLPALPARSATLAQVR
jgi:hypothetical protein